MFTSPQPAALLLEHLRQEARSAHNNISHRPDQRGDMVISDYSAELSTDRETISGWATDETADKVEDLLSRYHADYVSKLRSWIGATSRCASWFITGPANFPVERMRKRTASADNRYAEFRAWREKALKGIRRTLQPTSPVDELAEARTKLANREAFQEKMKNGNKAIRAAKGDEAKATEKLKEMGFDAKSIHGALHPPYGKVGFPAWMLSNNNAEIRRLTDRVKVLEAKEAEGARVGGERRVAFAGGEVILNYEADRVQIAHEAKPDGAVIAKLKQAAFKWSPTNQAWQRKITPYAIADAQRITGAVLVEPKPARVLPLVEAVEQAVRVLPQAWRDVAQPYPAEVEQLVMEALAGAQGQPTAALLAAAEELQAALPDAALASRSDVPRHIIDSLNFAIRTARDERAAALGATLPDEASADDEAPEARPQPV